MSTDIFEPNDGTIPVFTYEDVNVVTGGYSSRSSRLNNLNGDGRYQKVIGLYDNTTEGPQSRVLFRLTGIEADLANWVDRWWTYTMVGDKDCQLRVYNDIAQGE